MGNRVEVRWKREGLSFEATGPRGAVAMGAAGDAPGGGSTPMEVLLMAVGGCTGIDVASILLKMRQPLEELRIEVEGEEADQYPEHYTSVKVTYYLTGALDEAKVRRAIELSEKKYCSVEATLRRGVPVDSSYVLVPPGTG